MEIFNGRYSGFIDYKELIKYIIDKEIGSLEFIKVVEIGGEFYGVGIENPLKQIAIGKEVVSYIDGDGYFITENSDKLLLPYKIENYTWSSYTSLLHDDYSREVDYLKLYHIEDETLLEVTNPINCYFLFLINTFAEKYYSKDEFENYYYSSKKNIQLLKKDIFGLNEINVLKINPFKSKILFTYNNEIVETQYRAIVSNYRSKNTGMEHYNIVGFQVKPIIKVNSNTRESLTGQLDTNFVLELKKCEPNIIIKIFEKGNEFIKILANNTLVELNKETIKLLLENGCNIKTYIDNLSKKRKNQILSNDGYLIEFIDNPSNTMIRISIENDFGCISKIKNINYELFEELIDEYPECLQYIDKMNYEFQELLLNKNINNIKYFKDISQQIFYKYSDKIDISMLQNNKIKKNFLQMKSWRCFDNGNVEPIKDVLREGLLNKYKDLIKNVENHGKYEMTIIDPKEPVNIHIEVLSELINLEKLEIATGFLYSTGLGLISKIIDNLINQNKQVKLLIGSLRDYKVGTNINMDKKTAEYLNLFIKDGVEIGTYLEKFFHGKLYILKGKEYSGVIVGSSNVSSGGFYNNFETNIIILVNNNDSKVNEYDNYFNNIWENCCILSELELSRFEDELVFNDVDNVKTHNDINNDEVERHFSYLINEKPKKILKDIKIFRGQVYEDEYCGFYFEQYQKLLVLESVKYENAIYIFRNVNNLDQFINQLKGKEESMHSSNFVDRIYHSRDFSHANRVIDIINNYKIIYNIGQK